MRSSLVGLAPVTDAFREDLDQPVALTTELGDTTLLASPQIAELVDTPGDTTVDRRVVVRQAAEALTSQHGQLRVARSQRLPQLTLSSDFAELGYPGNGSPFGADYLTDWTVSVGLSLPLFTGGRIRGEVESARAGVTQAELRLKQTRERAQLDTRNASLQLEAAVAAWEASAGTEEQAARAYEIADLRYREGLSTQTELNDVRIQLGQAQSTRARAARDLQLARARVTLLPALPLTTVAAPAFGEPAPAAPPAPTQPPPPTTPTTSAASGVPAGTAFR